MFWLFTDQEIGRKGKRKNIFWVPTVCWVFLFTLPVQREYTPK